MRAILACIVVVLFGTAALAQSATPEQKAQLAPTGALRAAIVTIPFLAKKDATGALTGVAPDLAAEMARVLGLPYQRRPSRARTPASRRCAMAWPTSPSSRRRPNALA